MKKILPVLLLMVSNFLFAQRIILPEPRPRPRPNQTFRNQPLETKSLRIEATMNDQVAQVQINQVFHNATNRRIEGMYLFPIPKGMTVQNFSMEIDGKPMDAELLTADKARSIYEDIVRRQIDPALMEYQDGGLIKLRIFPIAPNADRRISLKFETELMKDYQLSLLELPIPRTNIQQLILDFKIQTESSIGSVICPTHEIDVAYLSPNKVHASSEAKKVLGGGKLQFYFGRKDKKIDANFLSYVDNDDQHFFQLSLSPGFADQKEIVGKDITFALDVSGSMRGQKLEQAKRALTFCVNKLNKQDQFNIIRFSTEATTLFTNRKMASAENIQRALQWIDQLKAAGGTNIYDALDIALSEPNHSERPEMTVFITDGRPTIGNTLPKEITKMVDNKLKENRRIFTFGVGNDLNVKLLDLLTEHSNGFRTYVSEQEDIALKVGNFFRKVASPVLTNIKITTSSGVRLSELQPKKLPDLFGGATLSLFGKYTGKDKFNITLTGEVNGTRKNYVYHFKPQPEIKNDFIPRLWATRKVAYLYDQIRLNGEHKEVKDELIATAKKYGIITPYTSFLIIEDEANLLRRGRLGVENAIWNQKNRRLPSAPEKEEIILEDESTAVQKSRVSSNVAQNKYKTLDYIDADGQTQNLAQEVQFVNGRAFYKQDRLWIDANVMSNTQKLPEKKIIYASKAYFDLLSQKEMQQYLSIGSNIAFIHNNTKYMVVDN